MIKIIHALRTAFGLAILCMSATLLSPSPATAQNPNMEVIHHPNYDQSVFMPFVPGIKIKSGKILWLAGTTALPVYHDHPHKRDPALHSRTLCTTSCSGRDRGSATLARRAR